MKFFRLLLVAIISLTAATSASADVTVGAARSDIYLPMLEGKRVGLLSNHTGIVDGEHTLDRLLRQGVDVRKLFSPEHGFRGTADAGEHVSGSIDPATKLPIISLYGKKSHPTAEQLDDIDVIICDLQDVGLRFYTYYITMLDLMQSAADTDKLFIVFDRPNPNGMTVDGPVLDMSLRSGVGRLPIPVVHGMTLGELARMIVGEGWLGEGRLLDLVVIGCDNYTRQSRYRLPLAPSPNLPDMKSIYLYPSTCLFEGTVMSLGRGTDTPFQIYGHPLYTGSRFSFTPVSRPGAKTPPLMNRRCFGRDLSDLPDEEIISRGINLDYVIDAYRNKGMKRSDKFFTPFFDKLIGNTRVRKMIEQGASADEIRATWADDVEKFKQSRKPYLLYPEE